MSEASVPPATGSAVARPARRRAVDAAVLAAVLALAGAAVLYAVFERPGAAASRPSGGDVRVISEGEAVDLAAHAVKGKYTIYDFYADWCAPCRTLDPQLHELAATHENVAVRKIDIIDWTTPVVAQHKVSDLPHMVIYGPDGKHLASGDEVYLVVSRLFQTELY